MTDKKFMLMVEKEAVRRLKLRRDYFKNSVRRTLAPCTPESKELRHRSWLDYNSAHPKSRSIHKASFMAGAEYALTILKIEARQKKMMK